MLLKNLLSTFALIFTADATVLPNSESFNDPGKLTPEQRLALEWALDLIGHKVGVYRNVADDLFLVHYGFPISGITSRQTLLLDGAGQLVSALSPVIADSLKKPCVPVPATANAKEALQLLDVNEKDLPPLPTGQAQHCDDRANPVKPTKGTDTLNDLLGKLPLVSNLNN